MGETAVKEKCLAVLSDGRSDGAYKDNVYGSYVHGIFDSHKVSGAIVKALYARKDMEYGGMLADRKKYKEMQYDLLADEVRRNVDMDLIYKILRKKV